MTRRWVIRGLVAGFVLGAAPLAMSLWSAPGAGDGVATSGAVNPGNAPSATVSGGTVTLSWAASTLSNGGAVDGYIVKRYDSTGALQAWWDLEEGSGERRDAHGGNHLADINSVTQAEGVAGNAAQFTAADSEYLSVADNPALSMGDIDFTLAGWVYLDSLGTTNRALVQKFTPGGIREYRLLYYNSGARFRFSVSPDGTAIANINADSLGAPTTGAWYFLVAWHDATANTINIQVNDGSVDSLAHAGGVFDGDIEFRLGRQSGNGTEYHDGRLDSVGVWKRVLTPAERTWLYNGGSGRSYADIGSGTEQSIGSGTCASQVSGLTCDETSVPEGTWTYSVTPAFQNWRGAESPKTSVTVTGGDVTGPAITISHPSTGSNLNDASYIAGCGTASTEEICGTASDPSGISTLKISIREESTGKYWNGAAAFNDATESLFDVTGTANWTYAILASKFTETSYTIRVVGTDTLSNTSATTSTFRMDRTAPTAAITFPVSGSSYNAAGYEAGCGTATTGDLCGTAADSGGSGLATVKVSIQRGTGNYWNGTSFGSATDVLFDATGTTSWSSAFAAANFSTDGSYTVRAKALDASGNTGTVASSAFTVDTTAPPVPTITANPSNPSNTASPSFSFTDGEGGVTFQCQLDGGGYSACTSPKSYTGVSDGSHTFSVKARDAVGNESAAASYTWTVDATAPTAAIAFPVSGAVYNAAGYNAGCGTSGTGDFCGTAGDGGTGLATVRVSIQQGTGKYWNGAGFTSSSEVLLTPTGTTTWSYGFAAGGFSPDGSYTVRAKATDTAGNTTTATSTFTIDTTVPAASDVQSANGTGGINGKPEAGDTVTYTYTEAMDAGSILSGWSGASTNVVVRLTDGGAGNDTMTVWDSTDTTQLNVGSVNLGRADFVTGNVTFGATGTPSTMVKSGSTITVTLGTVSNSALTGTAGGNGNLVWTPSASAKDLAGNACSTANKTESGNDKDF